MQETRVAPTEDTVMTAISDGWDSHEGVNGWVSFEGSHVIAGLLSLRYFTSPGFSSLISNMKITVPTSGKSWTDKMQLSVRRVLSAVGFLCYLGQSLKHYAKLYR